MGDGLKRAVAAAAATSIDTEMRRFLDALAKAPNGEAKVSSVWLPCCTREQDKARVKSRKAGLAVCERKPMRWILTDAGRAALAAISK